MNQVKAIETRYNGYRFRSRLEARWAVFFDHMGIKYEYEKEGYDLGYAGWYLPDFWLPSFKCWVEVKSGAPSSEEYAKGVMLQALTRNQVLFFGPMPKTYETDFIVVVENKIQLSPDYLLNLFGEFDEGLNILSLKCPLCSSKSVHLSSSKNPILHDIEISLACNGGCESVFTVRLLGRNRSAIDLLYHEKPGENPLAPFIEEDPSLFMSAIDAAKASRFEHGENGAA